MVRTALTAMIATLDVVAVAAPTDDAFAGIPGTTIHYYDVTGHDPAELRAAIDRQRPRDPNDGARVDAMTTYRYAWRWPGDGQGGCDLHRADVTFTATVLLPRLAAGTVLSQDAQDRWDRYITALARHEARHVFNGYAIRTMLAEAIGHATCETADAAARRVLARATTIDIAYDRRTMHGIAEGATFP